jgi:hypothetical protein
VMAVTILMVSDSYLYPVTCGLLTGGIVNPRRPGPAAA